MRIHILSLSLIFIFFGCASTPTASVTNIDDMQKSTMSHTPSSSDMQPDLVKAEQIAIPDFRAKEILVSDMSMDRYDKPAGINVSLLKSGQSSLSEEALNKILSSRVVLPRKGHLAIMKFPGPEHTASIHFGKNYHRSESYLKTQNFYTDILTQKLEKSDRVVAVTLLPSLLSPMDAGIPVLREAAVRLQADLLLAFRISSNIYNQSDSDTVKAFCTFEAVLMDIRTGLIPYTTVVTRDSEQKLSFGDDNINDVSIRAEKEAVLSSLSVVADEITEFLRSVP